MGDEVGEVKAIFPKRFATMIWHGTPRQEGGGRQASKARQEVSALGAAAVGKEEGRGSLKDRWWWPMTTYRIGCCSEASLGIEDTEARGRPRELIP